MLKSVFVLVNFCFQIFELFFPFLTDWPSLFFFFFDKGVIFRIFLCLLRWVLIDWCSWILGNLNIGIWIVLLSVKWFFFSSLLETRSFVFLGSLRWTF